MRTIDRTWEVEDVLTNVTSAKLSDPTGTFGIKRNDTDAVVVADGTDMTLVATGRYRYEFDEPDATIAYTAYVEIVYAGATYHFEVDLAATEEADDSVSPMAIGYADFAGAVGHYLGWGYERYMWSNEQQTLIDRYVRSGLLRFYNPPGYTWLFLQPETTITTEAPYSTGTVAVSGGTVTLTDGTWPAWTVGSLLKVSDNYYNVVSRDSSSTLTIDDSDVDVDAGASYSLAKYAYDLPSNFSHVDRILANRDDISSEFPIVKIALYRKIRPMLIGNPMFDYPCLMALRPKTFDDDVGQRYQAVFYPVADAAYTFYLSYRVTPAMISWDDPYPLGGTEHAEVIQEACLAAAERGQDGIKGLHNDQFEQLLAAAIDIDQRHHCPEELGPDDPRDERNHYGVGDSYRYFRSSRIGTVTLDGDSL